VLPPRESVRISLLAELVCWLWHCAATAVALKRHEHVNAFNLVKNKTVSHRCHMGADRHGPFFDCVLCRMNEPCFSFFFFFGLLYSPGFSVLCPENDFGFHKIILEIIVDGSYKPSNFM